MAVEFRSALTKNDLISGDIVVAVGQYSILGKRTIQAGELLSIGFGQESGMDSAQGRIFIDIKNNAVSPGAVLDGTLRLSVYTPQMRYLVNLGEWRTETLRSGAGDRTKQIPLNESVYQLSEDKILCLEFLPDVAGTVGKNNSSVLLDTTEVQA